MSQQPDGAEDFTRPNDTAWLPGPGQSGDYLEIGGPRRPGGSRQLTIVAGIAVVALLGGAGVAYAVAGGGAGPRTTAASSGSSPSPGPSATQCPIPGSAGSAGSAGAPLPCSPSGGGRFRHAGFPFRGGPLGALGFGALGGLSGVVHGQVIVAKPGGGYQTFDVQTGKVTSVSSTSITLRSTDGYTASYAVAGSTIVDAQRDGIGSVKTGNQVSVVATVSGSQATASSITDFTLVAGGHNNVFPWGSGPAGGSQGSSGGGTVG
jgi:hypothetical protein